MSKKVLVVGPHPDDLEFGCGGTLYKMMKSGHKISILIITSGEVGGDSKVRRAEQEKSAGLLKADLFWGGFRDTDVPMGRELINVIEDVIRKVKPDLVLIPWREDTHQDHRRVSAAATTAARHRRNVLYYEVPTTQNFQPTVFEDISAQINDKMKLLRAHKSQVYQTDVQHRSILEASRATAIFRGYQNRGKYAEGFVPMRLALTEDF